MKIGSKHQVSCQKILEITLGDVPFDCYVCVCVCVWGGGGRGGGGGGFDKMQNL